MRFTEIELRPKLVKLHYFNVTDHQLAQELGMKQDKNRRWYLPQYDRSGRGFDQAATTAIRAFGRPNSVNLS